MTSMRFRKLRIAWSVVWGLACVLLIVLWVRSYWLTDGVTWNGGCRVEVFSNYGQIRSSMSTKTVAGAPSFSWGKFRETRHNMRDFYYWADRQSMFVTFPHRLPIAVLAAFAAMPWIRFSLR